jgi:hypothetical protein
MTNPIQLQRFLGGVDYPATREDLVRHAESQGADREVLDTLRNLPKDRFEGPNAVSAAASGKHE